MYIIIVNILVKMLNIVGLLHLIINGKIKGKKKVINFFLIAAHL